MAEAHINPAILTWALERAGLDGQMLATRLHTGADRVSAWESGERKPTFKQAQRIAEITHIPFGYFYLPQPPEEPLPIADFRTIGDEPVHALGPDFRDLLNDVLRKQAWFREYRQLQNFEPLPFIGRFSVADSPTAIATDIARTLAVTAEDRASSQNWEVYLRLLIEKIEAAGILVMRSGIVGNNTHRPLSVDEFRGFVVTDPYAPLIFINGKDARAAQIFTVVHELAHIWLGESGVSNEKLGEAHEHDGRVERVCNATAAEFLVPAIEIQARWNVDADLALQAKELTRTFKVSSVVVARRAAELGLTTWPRFFAFYRNEREAWLAAAQQAGGGGDAYKTSAVRNGKLLTKAVLESAFEGRVLLRDAGSLLGVAPSNLKKLAASVYGDE